MSVQDSTDTIDLLLEHYLTLLDEYTTLRATLNTLQADVYHSLARANFSADRGIRYYGQDYYDERMQAGRRVCITPAAGADKNPTFAVVTHPSSSPPPPPQNQDKDVDGQPASPSPSPAAPTPDSQSPANTDSSTHLNPPKDADADADFVADAQQQQQQQPSPPPTPDPTTVSSNTTTTTKPPLTLKQQQQQQPHHPPTPPKPADDHPGPADPGPAITGGDPLRWFGILTPPALRQAQAHAIRAVEGVVPRLAAVSAQMAALEVQVRRERKKRVKLGGAAREGLV